MAVRALSSTLKTLAICDVVAASPRPMRLPDVVRATGDQRAAVYQRLRTLVEAGLLDQTPDGAFRLALRFQFYAVRALEQANLGERSTELLQEIVSESGETATISVLDGYHAVIINRVESRQVLRADLRVGAHLTLGGSASGSVLVAYGSPEMRARLREQGIALPDDAQLAEVRARGFAIFAPIDPQLVAAVAAPVLDAAGQCVAVIAISGPTTRFDHDRCGPIAVAAARRFSAQFGHA
ncbi:IclR family transcriptional regulator [Vineibacter terrae]|uniref:IclR family transcriptional regulator n=1 Tax=Vineibacter terrae TaxID=2586908 RepID=UPI002E2EDEFF|nr:IclR family transcriptional regulator [Vineibacter terrae]HEX2890576.1 IclR family transcriptional regulator [Vineibacter terrae]